jgi:hypothetical protein
VMNQVSTFPGFFKSSKFKVQSSKFKFAAAASRSSSLIAPTYILSFPLRIHPPNFSERKSSMTNDNSRGGITFPGLLTIVFIVLKLTHYINWSWIWVLSPIWISLAIVLFVLIIIVIVQIAAE